MKSRPTRDLVDDQEFVRDLETRILSQAGYNGLAATNGKGALDLFEKERTQTSLATLDLICPRFTAKSALKSFRIDPQAKALIATGLSADSSPKEPVEMGTRGFVSKPLTFKKLSRQVRKFLDEGRIEIPYHRCIPSNSNRTATSRN